MPRIEVDRLSLEVPGLSPEEGRRLAEMVAEGLAGVRWPDQPPGQVEASVAAPPGGAGIHELATTILRELQRQLG